MRRRDNRRISPWERLVGLASAVLGALLLPLMLQLLIKPGSISKYTFILWIVAGSGIVVWLVLLWHDPKKNDARKQLPSGEHPSDKMAAITNTEFRSSIEPPRPVRLVGREAELRDLRDRLENQETGAVYIEGLPGVGKTSLMSSIADLMGNKNRPFFWFSLAQAPAFSSFLNLLVSEAVRLGWASPPNSSEPVPVFDFLKSSNKKLTLVLDSFEGVLDEAGKAFKPGYDDYLAFLEAAASVRSSVKLVIGSTMPLPNQTYLAAKLPGLRIMSLAPLTQGSSIEYLQQLGLTGQRIELEAVAHNCGQVPLALRFAAAEVLDIYGGRASVYLDQVPYGAADAVIERQYGRLSTNERDILRALCIKGVGCSPDDVRACMFGRVPLSDISSDLSTLASKALIERNAQVYYTLDTVSHFTIERINYQIAEELRGTASPDTLRRFRLANTSAPDYVRAAQKERLLRRAKSLAFNPDSPVPEILSRAQAMIDEERTAGGKSFLVSNLLELLISSDINLSGLDVSDCLVDGVDFRAAVLVGFIARKTRFRNCRFAEPLGLVLCMTKSPDERVVLAGTSDGEVRAWAAASLEPLWVLGGHRDWVRSIAISSDQTEVATGCDDGSIRVWDLRTNELQFIEYLNSGKINALEFEGANEILVGLEDGSVRRLVLSRDGREGIWARSSDTGGGAILDISVWANAGLVAVACYDSTIRLLKSDDLSEKARLTGHDHAVQAVAFAVETGLLVSACAAGKIICWEPDSWIVSAVMRETGGLVWSLAITPNAEWLAAGDDIGVWVWRNPTIESVPFTFARESHGRVRGVCLSRSGEDLLLACEDHAVRRLTVDKGEITCSVEGVSRIAWTCMFRPGTNDLIVGMGDGRIIFWEYNPESKQWKQARETRDSEAGVWSLAISRTGRLLASCSRSTDLVVRDFFTLDVLKRWKAHMAWAKEVLVANDESRIYSCSEDGTVRVWSVATGIELASLRHDGWVRSIALTHNERALVTACDDGIIRLWDLASMSMVGTLTGHRGWVWAVRVIDDSTLVSGGEDGTLRFWSLQDLSELRTIEAHQSRIRQVAVSPDHQMIATASDDQTARIWSANGDLICDLSGHTGLVRGVSFSSSGEFLATTSFDGTTRVWDCAGPTLVQSMRPTSQYEDFDVSGAVGLSLGELATILEMGGMSHT